MKRQTNARKNLFNILFLVLIIGATAWYLFRDQDMPELLSAVAQARKEWLAAGVVLVVLYVCGESVIIRYLLGKLGKKAALSSCIRYSFIGFFFSCITPSASGGQPAQVYYMKRNGIELTDSALVLLIVTITYKFVLVFLGALLCLFGNGEFWMRISEVKGVFFLGMALNVVCVAAMLLIVFDRGFAKKAVMGLLGLAERCHLLKPSKERSRKWSNAMDEYHAAAGFFVEHPGVIGNVFLITLVQRICLFAVTYLVHLAFGGSGDGIVLLPSLQAVISISVDMLPLPGGMGISEGLFLRIFPTVFGEDRVLPAMLLSRGISYYVLLILSAAVTGISQLLEKKRAAE
ncbi:MAG: flippase-like domain-containing protein [Lachnospiraceae bacterium]|nr:flippase-like domain-containing protein [Lachnospiraceae bacterium]